MNSLTRGHAKVRALSTRVLTVLDQLIVAGVDLTAAIAELATLNGLTASVEELNVLDGVPAQATFTIGAEVGNVINVGAVLKDANGVAVVARKSVFAYLSDDANGDSIAAVAPDGGVAIGTNGLAIPVVADKAFQFVSESNGTIDLNITHAAGAKTVRLVLVFPNGKLQASAAITFA